MKKNNTGKKHQHQEVSTLSPSEALQQVIAGLADPAKHYMVNANYYEHLQPDLLTSERWYIACIYFHQDAVWNVELADDGLLCDVLLDRDQPSEKFRIKILYEEIWEVLERENDAPNFTSEGRIYYNAQILKKLTFPPNESALI